MKNFQKKQYFPHSRTDFQKAKDQNNTIFYLALPKKFWIIWKSLYKENLITLFHIQTCQSLSASFLSMTQYESQTSISSE